MKVFAHKSPKYPPRTTHNANSADLTVAFAEDFESAGERLTKKAAGDKYASIPLSKDPVEAARALYRECKKHNVKVLNVAGNGIYTLAEKGWSQASLNFWVYQVIALVHKHRPFEMIISGGQTGVDFAGGVAAEVLGLDPVMTFPKDFLQRTLTKYEHKQTEQDVLFEVQRQVEELSEMIIKAEALKEKPVAKQNRQVDDESPAP